MFLLLYGEKSIRIIIEHLCFASLLYDKSKKTHWYSIRWNRDKQYGFVNSMNNGVSYFLHRSKLDQDVCNGTIRSEKVAQSIN